MKPLLTIILIFTTLFTNATNYYVSNSGNDNDNGTINTPWQTLSKVRGYAFNAGDSVLFKRGDTFYGYLTISRSGSAGNPIVFGAYGTGANPIITGFTSVTEWTNLGGNIWESTNAVSALSNCNIVTINGVNTAMGRFPNANATNGGYLTINSHPSATSLTNNTLTGSPDWTGGELWIRNGNYTANRRVVTSQSTTTLNYNTSSGAPVNNGFFIQNHLSSLDLQNEWFYNSTTHKISIYSTSQPSNVNVTSVGNLVTITGNYITLTYLKLTGANDNAVYCWEHNPRWHHIIIKNCVIENCGISAIYTLANLASFNNDTIRNINSCAISTTYGKWDTIRNCYIENIGVLAGMRLVEAPYELSNSAISNASSNGLNIKYCTIKNTGYNAISFYGDSILIKNNFIDTFCTVLDDGGGVYTYTGTGGPIHSNIIIDGNIVLNGIGTPYGVSSRFPSPGIYLDEYSNNCLVINNSVNNCYKYNYFLNQTYNNTLRGNTSFNSSNFAVGINAWSPSTGLVFRSNILVAKTNTEGLITINSGTNDIPYRLTIDSNYYSRPTDNTGNLFYRSQPNGGYALTYAGWRSFMSQDLNSSISTRIAISENDIMFIYNSTNAPKTIILSKPGLSFSNKKYRSVTLQPYTSQIFFRDYHPNPKIFKGRGGKVLRGRNGKIYN